MQLDDITISSSLLPVELVSINAEQKESDVNLTWRTASELNNSHFAIERSTDGSRYREIGQVVGNGTSYELHDYTFTDESPSPGLNYYRLRQVDFDGRFEYSKVVSVQFDPGNTSQVVVYPTLATDEITVWFSQPTQEGGIVEIIDYQGKCLLAQAFGPEMERLPLSVSYLPAGSYFVRVVSGAEWQILRFVRM